MSKPYAVIAAFMIMFLAFAAASGAWAADTNAEIIIKAGTLAPKGVGWAVQVEKILLPGISRASDDRVFLKVYWGGIMGDDEDIIAKMSEGTLGGAGLSGQGAGLVCPAMSVVSLPFLFESYNEVDHIREKMLPAFDKLMTKNGYALIAWIDQDFDKIFSVNTPLACLEDFSDAKVVNWYGPLEKRVLERLGADPINMDVPQVAAAIKQGRVDATLAPSIWMVGAQLYSVIRYVNTMNIRYAPVLVVVSNRAWAGIRESDQKDMLAMRNKMTAGLVAGTRIDSKTGLDAMLKYGMEEINPDPENLARIRKVLEPIEKEMTGRLYTKKLLDELKGHLAQYRFQNIKKRKLK